ncbi:hypothetical protein [Bacillus sp. FJAT-27445]|uniref:hypothetical protein n=1 Tax=Bacillus sp. FJAT-27445 TaxID=1679166 RepID=UPI0012E3DFBC|nr:hypothetical protein [Bacillus sp. FJAT-27445]
MIEEITRFVAAFNNKPHIHYLFRSTKPVYIQIDVFQIEISEGKAKAVQGVFTHGPLLAEITGLPGAIAELLAGKARLRDLLSQGLVQVNASFRTVLKLESAFLLAKEHFSEITKISLLTE